MYFHSLLAEDLSFQNHRHVERAADYSVSRSFSLEMPAVLKLELVIFAT